MSRTLAAMSVIMQSTSPGIVVAPYLIPESSTAGSFNCYPPLLENQSEQLRIASKHYSKLFENIDFCGTGIMNPPTQMIGEVASERVLKATKQVENTVNVLEIDTAISSIRSLFSLTITELADVLEVKRPTVYSWLRGDSQPHASNLARIREILSMAKFFKSLNIEPARDLVRRSLTDEGKSLLDLLKSCPLNKTEIKSLMSKIALIAPLRIKKASINEILEKADGKPVLSSPQQQLSLDLLTGKRISED